MRSLRSKLISIVIAVFMLLTVCMIPIESVSAYSSTDVKWTEEVEGGAIYFDEATGKITDCDASVTSVAIPEEINGVSVTSIGNWAFDYCPSLTSITIPDSVTYLGAGAFNGCQLLEEVRLSNNIENRISYSTFEGCDNLKSIIMDNEFDQNKCVEQEHYNFINNGMLYTTERGNNLVKIIPVKLPQKSDFSSYEFNFDFVSGVNIGTSYYPNFQCFSGCTNLRTIKFTNAGIAYLMTMPSYEFEAAATIKNLEGIYLERNYPGSMSSIDGVLYDGCWTDGYCPNEGEGCKEHTTLKLYPRMKAGSYFEVPENTTKIGEYAFKNNDNLETIKLPKSIYEIHNEAFSNCKKLKNIVISDGAKELKLEPNCFYYCKELQSITIPPSVTNIIENSSVFNGCGGNTMIVYGEAGTYAETFAKKHNFQFKEMKIQESQLYGEYASYLNNNAYSAICSNLVSDTDAVLESGSDFWLYVKTSLKWIGDTAAVRIIKTYMGKDVTADELAEKQALDLVNSVSNSSSLMEDTMEEVKNGYDWTSKTYSVVSKGFKYASDYEAIKELVASGYCYSEESARELIEGIEDNWSEIDNIFKTAGVTVNAAQLTVQVAMLMEADYRVVSVLKENAPEGTWLYKGLDRIEKKIENGMGEELVKTLLQKGFFEEEADALARQGLELIPGVKYAIIASGIASYMIPVKDADQEVNAMIAGTNFCNLSIMRKGYVTKIIQNNKNGGTLSRDKLKEEYRIIFDAYIESLKQYIKYAEVKDDSKAKKKLEREYNAAEKYLNYDKYIESCLYNANADWQYESTDGNATITGLNKTETAVASAYSNLKTAAADDSDSLYILDIPENINGMEVTAVGAEALKDNCSLKAVYIPGTVVQLEESAFNGCINIDNVFLSNGIETIGVEAFNDCSALTEINVPYSLKSIGENAFSGIDSLIINASDGSEGQNYAENNSNTIFEKADCEVISISITNMPSKLEYMMDEDLDTAGMRVEATYEDGSKKDVTDEVYCDFDEKAVGTVKVNVYFADESASFDVNVKPSQCKYTVTYENEYCEEIADKFTGQALAGEEVELNIPEIKGYVPDEKNITKVIGYENDFVVTYTSNPRIKISETQINYEKEFKYTGEQIKPEVQIEYQGKKLAEDKDYYVDYEENIEAGKGKILICGTGDYAGDVWLDFDIKSNTIFGDNNIIRYAGTNRYETSFLAADGLKQSLGVDKFDNIIVASGDNYPDALAGSYLGKVKDAPILLVTGTTEKTTADYIKSNLKEGGTVYLLGGTGVVSSNFEKMVKGSGVSVDRLAGANRYDTNIAILKEAGVKSEDILVCSGSGYADSLSASAVGKPILLVYEKITAKQQSYLDTLSTKNMYLIGGTGAVSKAVEKDLNGYTLKRFAGANRFETSTMVANEFFPKSECIVLAYGYNFPDGLSGGPLAMSIGAPLVLTSNESACVNTARNYAITAGVSKAVVLGGKTLISDQSVMSIIN